MPVWRAPWSTAEGPVNVGGATAVVQALLLAPAKCGHAIRSPPRRPSAHAAIRPLMPMTAHPAPAIDGRVGGRCARTGRAGPGSSSGQRPATSPLGLTTQQHRCATEDQSGPSGQRGSAEDHVLRSPTPNTAWLTMSSPSRLADLHPGCALGSGRTGEAALNLRAGDERARVAVVQGLLAPDHHAKPPLVGALEGGCRARTPDSHTARGLGR